jgi:lysine-N-methylase
MSQSEPQSFHAFRYMTRFRCIGASCEASCCAGGWQIAVDREHFEKTKKRMQDSTAERQEFDAKLKPVKGPARSGAHYALVVLQNNGTCSFFDADGLCSLHKRFGEDVLSDTCALYPRSPAISGKRRELTGMTSCPEVARQLLLHADAMELDEVPPSTFSRTNVHKQLPERPVQPYLRYHDELRSLVLQLLSEVQYPLRSRLFFVAYFGGRTQPFLQRDSAALDELRLEAELQRIQSPELLQALHQHFEQLPVDTQLPSRLVLTLAASRAGLGEFGRLLSAVIGTYAGVPDTREAASLQVQAPEMVRAYAERKAAWSEQSARIDGYLTNFAKNFWAREWYVQSPNLLAHQLQLLSHIAALRFLLHGHPKLTLALGQGLEEQQRALDEAVVDVVHRFSRAFEHDIPFRRRFQEQLIEGQLVSLAHAACLAGF